MIAEELPSRPLTVGRRPRRWPTVLAVVVTVLLVAAIGSGVVLEVGDRATVSTVAPTTVDRVAVGAWATAHLPELEELKVRAVDMARAERVDSTLCLRLLDAATRGPKMLPSPDVEIDMKLEAAFTSFVQSANACLSTPPALRFVYSDLSQGLRDYTAALELVIAAT